MWDLREAFSQGDALCIAAAELWKQIEIYRPDYIIGRGIGSLPLLTAIQMESLKSEKPVKWNFVRDTRKDRNRCKLIEGVPMPSGSSAIIVDDLLTSGDTIRQTLKAYESENIEFVFLAVAVVLDQWRSRGSRLLEVMGKDVIRLFKRHDFGITRIDEPYEKEGVLVRKWWNFGTATEASGYLYSTPSIEGARLFIGTDRTSVQCLNLETGDNIWERKSLRPMVKSIAGAPQLFDNKVIWSAYDGNVTCCEQATGKLIWERKCDSWLHSTLALDTAKRRVFLGTEYLQFNQGFGDCLALDLDTGKELWRYRTDHYIPCSPYYYPKNDLVIIGSNDMCLYILRAEDGSYIASPKTKGEVKGQPIVHRNKIYASTERGYLHCFDLEGNELWTTKLGNALRHVRPVVHNDLVIVPNNDGFILAVDKDDGKLAWVVQLRNTVNYSVTPYLNKYAFAVQVDGYLALIDLDAGKKVWIQRKLISGIQVDQPVKIHGNKIFVTTNKGLGCYELNTSDLQL